MTHQIIETIVNNTPGILTGIGGILTAIITARQSREQSQKEEKEIQEELKDKISLRTIQENKEFRSQLLNELFQNNGEFLKLIEKLGGFPKACNVDKQFEECKKAFDDRLIKALNDPRNQNTLKDICHLITKEELDDELKECRFINANREARENLIFALATELKELNNRAKLDIFNQSEVLKQAENISMQTAKENARELKVFEEQLNQIQAQMRVFKDKDNLSSPTTQGV